MQLQINLFFLQRPTASIRPCPGLSTGLYQEIARPGEGQPGGSLGALMAGRSLRPSLAHALASARDSTVTAEGGAGGGEFQD